MTMPKRTKDPTGNVTQTKFQRKNLNGVVKSGYANGADNTQNQTVVA